MLTTLILAAVVGVYGRREYRSWIREGRCMYEHFSAAVERGRA